MSIMPKKQFIITCLLSLQDKLIEIPCICQIYLVERSTSHICILVNYMPECNDVTNSWLDDKVPLAGF